MKLNIYINSAEDFCRGGSNLRWAFGALGQTGASTDKIVPDDWIFVRTIEIDEKLIDHQAVLNIASKSLDDSEREIRAKYVADMERIERRRGELLALPGVSS